MYVHQQREKMPRQKDPKKKLKVKARAMERGPQKNDEEFKLILAKLQHQTTLPKEKRDNDELIVCRVQNMEGTGNFHLFTKEGREYFGGCPGNLVLENMVGQLVPIRIQSIPDQPLVLVCLTDGKAIKKPEVVAIISDEDPGITRQRLYELERYGIFFTVEEGNYEFEKGAEVSESESEEEVDMDRL